MMVVILFLLPSLPLTSVKVLVRLGSSLFVGLKVDVVNVLLPSLKTVELGSREKCVVSPPSSGLSVSDGTAGVSVDWGEEPSERTGIGTVAMKDCEDGLLDSGGIAIGAVDAGGAAAGGAVVAGGAAAGGMVVGCKE